MDIPLPFRSQVDQIILDVKQSLIRRVVDSVHREFDDHSDQLCQSLWQLLVSELTKRDSNRVDGSNIQASSCPTNVQHQNDLSSVQAQSVSDKSTSSNAQTQTESILLNSIDGKEEGIKKLQVC